MVELDENTTSEWVDNYNLYSNYYVCENNPCEDLEFIIDSNSILYVGIPVKNNYLGTTFTRIDLYYTEPRITLYHKKDTPVTWTLGEQFDIVQHTYTADYGIVYYGYDSGRDIIVYKWNNDLNEWIIPDNIEN